MLSRYFILIPTAGLLSVVIWVGLTSGVSANSNVLLDSKGRPLPSDFGALLEQLGQSSDQGRKILGLTGSSSPVSVRSASENNQKKRVVKKPEPKTPTSRNTELARRLYDALKVGDTARAKWLLRSGAGNAYVTAENDTSLHLAVRRGWASVVRVLLEREREPDLEQKFPGNINLLHRASVKGAYDIAKMLVEAGMDPGETTIKGWTNLHLAARYGHMHMVRYYVSLGLDPDARNSEGNTAYWLANHLRHYQVAGYLSSRTHVSSYQLFGQGKGTKKNRKRKKRKKSKKGVARGFSPAQLEALKNL